MKYSVKIEQKSEDLEPDLYVTDELCEYQPLNNLWTIPRGYLKANLS